MEGGNLSSTSAAGDVKTGSSYKTDLFLPRGVGKVAWNTNIAFLLVQSIEMLAIYQERLK